MLVPAITSCGRCAPASAGWPPTARRLGGIGWIFGHLIDGVQAEYARVPYAETSVHPCPRASPTSRCCSSPTSCPTGFEIGVQNGGVRPGRHGRGRRRRAGRARRDDDRRDRRRGADHRGRPRRVAAEAARRASARRTPSSPATTPRQQICALTDGEGVDVAMEAVGVPATFDLCTRIVRAGGTRREHRRARRARRRCTSRSSGSRTSPSRPAWSAARRCRRCCSSCATARSRPTARHPSVRARRDMEAYDVFAAAGEHNALKVVLTAS